jgi:hypothetical protein
MDPYFPEDTSLQSLYKGMVSINYHHLIKIVNDVSEKAAFFNLFKRLHFFKLESSWFIGHRSITEKLYIKVKLLSQYLTN